MAVFDDVEDDYLLRAAVLWLREAHAHPPTAGQLREIAFRFARQKPVFRAPQLTAPGCDICGGRGFEVMDTVPEGRHRIGPYYPNKHVVACPCREPKL